MNGKSSTAMSNMVAEAPMISGDDLAGDFDGLPEDTTPEIGTISSTATLPF